MPALAKRRTSPLPPSTQESSPFVQQLARPSPPRPQSRRASRSSSVATADAGAHAHAHAHTHESDPRRDDGHVDSNANKTGSGSGGSESQISDAWYEIKDIIDEKLVKVKKRQRIFYLVDWADHPETGASYPPSWIPARDASAGAVSAWKAAKRASLQATTHHNNSAATAQQKIPIQQTASSSSDSISSNPVLDSKARKQLGTTSRALRPDSSPPGSSKNNSHTTISSSIGSSHDRLVLFQSSRENSSESPEPRPPQTAQEEDARALFVELSQPGSAFDPDQYLRFSQLSQAQVESQLHLELLPQSPSKPQPQPHPQIQPQSEPQSESWNPETPALAPQSSRPSSPRSLRSVPGSQAESAHPESQIGTDVLTPLEPNPSAATPGPQASLSDQPAQHSNQIEEALEAHPVNQLRESVEWLSQEAPAVVGSQPALPWDDIHSGPAESTNSASKSTNGSVSIHFLTQPGLAFDLLSQAHESQTPPASPVQSNSNLSVIPDSRPEQSTRVSLPSAQIVPPLFSERQQQQQQQSLFSPRQLSPFSPPPNHVTGSGSNSCDFAGHQLGQNASQASHTSIDHLRSRSPTPYQEESLDITMAEGDAPSSTAKLLMRIGNEALGSDILNIFDDLDPPVAEQPSDSTDDSAAASAAAGTNAVSHAKNALITAEAAPKGDVVPSEVDKAASKLPLTQSPANAELDVEVPASDQEEPSATVQADRPSNELDMHSSPVPKSDAPALFESKSVPPVTSITPSALSLEAPIEPPSPASSEGAAVAAVDSFPAYEPGQSVHGGDEAVGSEPAVSNPASLSVDEEKEVDDDNDEDNDMSLSPSNPRVTTREYSVILPLAANIRQRYVDLVMEKENQKAIEEFGQVFARDTTEVPDADSVARVDELLHKLVDMSDMPPFYDSLPSSMTVEARMKHAVNTNSKFTFVHEFLEALGASPDRRSVLILARNSTLLDYLEAVMEFAELPVRRLDTDRKGGRFSKDARSSNIGSTSDHASVSVLLSNTQAQANELPQDVDIVIGFDHTARTSGLVSHYLSLSETGTSGNGILGMPKPLILQLVAAFSLEHIDQQRAAFYSQNGSSMRASAEDDLERKNALLLCTLECLPYLQDMPSDDMVPAKPHEAAAAFSKLILSATADLDWKSVQLPEDVFDIYVQPSGGSSRFGLSQVEAGETGGEGGVPASRKRPLDDNDADGDTPKRARLDEPSKPLVPEQPVQVSETITAALGGRDLAAGGEPMVRISLAQLEALAAQAVQKAALEAQLQEMQGLETALENRLRTVDRQLKDYAATVNTCQRRLMEAQKDRGVFEVECSKATKVAETAKERLAARETALTELKAEVANLETRLADTQAAVAGTAPPEAVASQLVTAQTEAAAAQRKVAALERKLTNMETDLAHARRAYQEASNAAADLSSENRDLYVRTKDLDLRAADNLRIIHETHQSQEAEAYRRQWEDLQMVLRERERELEWVREELRVLKNGRRETRQQSVPRSPRLGVMSPRTISRGGSGPAGSGGGPVSGSGFASSFGSVGNNGPGNIPSSRGTSPVPGDHHHHYTGTGGASAGASGSTATASTAAAMAAASGGLPAAGSHNLAVPGMTYFHPQQSSGRWNYLRD